MWTELLFRVLCHFILGKHCNKKQSTHPVQRPVGDCYRTSRDEISVRAAPANFFHVLQWPNLSINARHSWNQLIDVSSSMTESVICIGELPPGSVSSNQTITSVFFIIDKLSISTSSLGGWTIVFQCVFGTALCLSQWPFQFNSFGWLESPPWSSRWGFMMALLAESSQQCVGRIVCEVALLRNGLSKEYDTLEDLDHLTLHHPEQLAHHDNVGH